jgi:hypothetical protein
MMGLIRTCARLWVSDWGLGPILESSARWIAFQALPIHDYITFDGQRLLEDVAQNILGHAYAGGGQQLDLVYKEAALRPEEHETLARMWGPPERTIFCLREPAGYVASARKKFPKGTVSVLQASYVRAMETCLAVGGDIFEYAPDRVTDDYIAFLTPLRLDRQRLTPFHYRGDRDEANTSEEMWAAYHKVKELLDRTGA